MLLEHAAGFRYGRIQWPRGLLEGGSSNAERLGDETDIIINGFWDADDGYLEPARLHLAADSKSGLHGAIAANDKEGIDVAALKGIHNFFRRLRPA